MAASLHDLIANGLNVFFFPRKQEELAGTDGLESMRTPFSTARVVVVLFREAWGRTPWTRVEQAAITDRFLTDGWDWLLFVQLDNVSTFPAWLPTTHVRFALEQYGVEQLAGAIKMRAQQQGGQIAPPTALGRARQVQREADLIADQKSLFRDGRWISDTFHPQLERLMARIQELAEEIAKELGMRVIARHEGKRCVLREDRLSMNVGWRQTYVNVIDEQDSAGLIFSQFTGAVFVPSEGLMTAFQPTELQRRTFLPTLTLARDVAWVEQGSSPTPISMEEMAQAIVTEFLDLIGRANRGEIELNYF